jgi:cell wall assembly regulator SMI1
MAIEEWTERWNVLRRACERHGATDRWLEGRSRLPRFLVGPPAPEAAVRAAERELGLALPPGFRRVLLGYAGSLDIAWQLPDDAAPPEEFRRVFAGECRWDLDGLAELQARYRGWVAGCFSDPDDPYDAVWHRKLVFLEIGTGDMLGIDLATPGREPVVFLSHDGGERHGCWLGWDFEDYVDRLSRLGCVGAEDWQLAPFVGDARSGLLPESPAARRWRGWFGLLPAGGGG